MIYKFKALDPRSNLKFDIDLDKDKKVYCFIGENGVGKTQLLENMARTLFLTNEFFKKDEPGILSASGSINTSLELKINDADIAFNERYKKDIAKDNQCIISWLFYNSLITTVSTDKALVFIAAKGRGYAKNCAQPKLLQNNEENFTKVLNLTIRAMNGQSDEVNNSIADWLVTRLMINEAFVSFDSKRIFEEAKAFFRVIAPLLADLRLFKTNGDGQETVNAQLDSDILKIGGIPIDKLSTGVVSLMRILQEIVSGYSAWNGMRETPLPDVFEMDGVVFIDEIEAHMHPKWQTQIIPLLKKSFPNTTFYIATHSPIIVATTEEGEAYELKRDAQNQVTAQKLGNPKDWYVEDLLSNAFEVSLPSSDEENTIEDALLNLSLMIRKFTAKSTSMPISCPILLEEKREIETLYHKIKSRLDTSPDPQDPRKETLEQLWSRIQ